MVGMKGQYHRIPTLLADFAKTMSWNNQYICSLGLNFFKNMAKGKEGGRNLPHDRRGQGGVAELEKSGSPHKWLAESRRQGEKLEKVHVEVGETTMKRHPVVPALAIQAQNLVEISGEYL